MSWRTVVVSNPARLKIEDDQLVIIQDESISLPVEDISTLMIESPQVTLSSALLDILAQHGTLLLICDKHHLPSVACLPFAGHSRLLGVQRLQLSMSEPFHKRCWQSIARRKILNQARCLELLAKPEAGKVAALADRVNSGDTDNIESVAAREHFQSAFGPGFDRGSDDPINSALNYGYAIIRASVARALALHGFLPTHGLHHHSELNRFNLADDFIEPLRPLVDLHTARVSSFTELTKEHRRELVGLLHVEVLVERKRQAVTRAVEVMAASYLSACQAGDPGLLCLPELLPLKSHSYE